MREQLLALVDEYVRAKRDHLLLDHGDQIALAARLAALAPVRAVERRSYEVVLLDEYQDTNVAQRILLQRLFGDGHPVTAVGDPAQSIYGFRGASVSNIVRFPEQFPHASGAPATIYPLTTNFRSGGHILAAANRVSGQLQRVGTVDPPVLVPRAGREAGGAEAGLVRSALLPHVELEAEWVADRLVEAATARREDHQHSCEVTGCAGWHEVAVLCRKRRQFALIRDALEKRDVPVEIVGLGGLLDTPEVADLVSVLRVLHDPTSNAAMIRLLTGPRWRIGIRDLDALGRRARVLLGQAGFRTRRPPVASPQAAESELLDKLGLATAADDVEVGALADALERLHDPELHRSAPLSSEAVARLDRLQAELAGLRRRIGQPLPDLVADVERTLGLDVELEASPGAVGRGRRANVLAFTDVAANFVGLEGETHLGSFLASLDAAEEAEDGYDIGTPSASDAVKLMTVHAAKGLEWDVVAVPGLADGKKQNGVFPSSTASPQWTTRWDRLPRIVRGDREDLPDVAEPTNKALDAFKDACRAKDLQEERRLAYVALTRAKEVLFCSGYWWGATAKTAQCLSPFFAEVEAACIDGAGLAEERAPEPEDGELNPLLDAERRPDVAWPPAPVIPTGVAEAAAAVRRARDEPETVPTPELDEDEQRRLAEWRRDAELLLEERRAAAGTVEVLLPADLSVSDVVTLDEDPARLARRLQRPLPQRPAPRPAAVPPSTPGSSSAARAVPCWGPTTCPDRGTRDWGRRPPPVTTSCSSCRRPSSPRPSRSGSPSRSRCRSSSSSGHTSSGGASTRCTRTRTAPRTSSTTRPATDPTAQPRRRPPCSSRATGSHGRT